MRLIEAIDGSIELVETVEDWREAVLRCGKMLYDKGCVEERYIKR